MLRKPGPPSSIVINQYMDDEAFYNYLNIFEKRSDFEVGHYSRCGTYPKHVIVKRDGIIFFEGMKDERITYWKTSERINYG